MLRNGYKIPGNVEVINELLRNQLFNVETEGFILRQTVVQLGRPTAFVQIEIMF